MRILFCTLIAVCFSANALAGRSKDLVEQKMQHYLQVKAVLSQLQNLDPSDLGFYDELQLRGSPQKIALNLAIKISQQEGSEFALTDFDVEGFGHQIARLCSDESRTVYTLQCLLAAFENTLAQP